MGWKTLLVAMSFGAALAGQDLGQLPAWARIPAEQARPLPAPKDAAAWVLLDRTEVAYVGGGQVRTHRFRVVRVVTEGGIGEGTYALEGLGPWQVKRLKGWNLRPDDQLVKLDREDVTTLKGELSYEAVSTRVQTSASLGGVVKGSIVAFESLEEYASPMGPAEPWPLLQEYPVRRLEFEAGKREGWFKDLKQVAVRMDLLNAGPWLPHADFVPGQRFAASDVPALPRSEGGVPYGWDALPILALRFHDPELKGPPSLLSWDTLATWEAGRFEEKAQPAPVLGPPEADLRAFLARVWTWMGRNLHYKQVYLSPERGWVPEDALEVARRAYGDCKDMTCFLLGAARGAGLQGAPALASIQGTQVGPELPSMPVFNHVITALKLQHSLGYPAEVETPEGRFLLADPTDPLTPLGLLGEQHRGRKVMLCLPGKAIWVQLPDAAIQKTELSVDLDADVQATGALQGTVTLTEAGQGAFLRRLATERTPRQFRDHLASSVLQVPPAGSLEVREHSDPWDLEKPFRVVLALTHPEGFAPGPGGATLSTLGLLNTPPPLQKAGVPRQFPVRVDAGPHLRLQASLRLPIALVPALADYAQHTVRRDLVWTARSVPDARGCKVTLALEQTTRDVSFGFKDREEGIQALRKDRSALKTFIEDGFFFREAPAP